MNKKLIAAAGIVAVCTVITLSLVFGHDQPSASQPTTTETTVSTSTAPAPTTQSQTSRSSGKSSASSALSASKTGAHYEVFNEAAFRAASSKTRLLFFYDASHAPSVALDSQLSTRAAELPDKLYIYRITMADHADIAEEFGITQPGTVLKFDTESQLAGVYIASANTSFDSFVTTLALK